MHRPTRISLVGMLIVPLWALFWSASESAEEGKTAQLLKMYQECVFDAVASQVKNGSAEVNPSAATEVAFQACRTEEQAIFAQAAAGGVAASQANQVITDYKLSLKQKIRNVFVNSERRAPQPAASFLLRWTPPHSVLAARRATRGTTGQQSTQTATRPEEGVSPNSAANLTMSLAALFDMPTNGF
jgi:hypothetical protein